MNHLRTIGVYRTKNQHLRGKITTLRTGLYKYVPRLVLCALYFAGTVLTVRARGFSECCFLCFYSLKFVLVLCISSKLTTCREAHISVLLEQPLDVSVLDTLAPTDRSMHTNHETHFESNTHTATSYLAPHPRWRCSNCITRAQLVTTISYNLRDNYNILITITQQAAHAVSRTAVPA
ncbi:hypothetical protein NP493_317g01015 [Ridgeia piscesae]|uniref:Uncharacterized protein n=1 Tax=Ridgeia piscesae TaxID=27915 RepID=A0AAD9L5J0_RIDPI|nr:hypothetical protein NP493_317g01015 [Ridgeia piscesae]